MKTLALSSYLKSKLAVFYKDMRKYLEEVKSQNKAKVSLLIFFPSLKTLKSSKTRL